MNIAERKLALIRKVLDAGEEDLKQIELLLKKVVIDTTLKRSDLGGE